MISLPAIYFHPRQLSRSYFSSKSFSTTSPKFLAVQRARPSASADVPFELPCRALQQTRDVTLFVISFRQNPASRLGELSIVYRVRSPVNDKRCPRTVCVCGQVCRHSMNVPVKVGINPVYLRLFSPTVYESKGERVRGTLESVRQFSHEKYRGEILFMLFQYFASLFQRYRQEIIAHIR